MRGIGIIAINTYREIIRDRILYGLVVFAVLLMGLSLLLGELSFAEQARITMNFGLVAAQLSSVVLSIFIGSSLVFKEIEKRTIQTLLVRPVSREQFLVGKFLGLLLVQLVIISGLALVLVGILSLYGISLNGQFFGALHGIFLEAFVLLAVTMFFSMFATPTMVVAFSVSIFLIGHWQDSLRFFTKKEGHEAYRVLGRILEWVVPNLELFNWRSHVVYKDSLPLSQLGFASLYALGWFVVLLTLASLIFRRRDFA